MKQTHTLLSLLPLAALLSGNALAQDCVTNVVPTQLDYQYLDNLDGTVSDVRNNLIWSKCNLGETYKASDNSCDGLPTNYKAWQEALLAAKQYSDADPEYTWVLPNIKELNALVDYSCVRPAIDQALFPTTVRGPYWSSTPNTNIDYAPDAYIIDFTNGSQVVSATADFFSVRLIRVQDNDES
ncbi:DUF1566 domain-containing protein [Photobacterium sp. ZSDE20]|uniref:DUF1566 domain-containing protein n=1 Tax=Photobacterium pectinilyticum TaxID=2906793 RepID=A0ABT1N8E5_9GAMM|nr:DUF1566 domain-containing protein [Photobacterium sp. ZSDE20]MCQ1060119.1 DUF1566 domain-containing protein [Photobacterium sp. ZSDE20]MDD1827575.1 DUF1566 domain-containing protein [Photobacterium sp. ZSDE20]